MNENSLREVIAALHGPDWRARDAAIDDLVKLGEPGVDPLLDALESLPDRVKPQIARALGRIGSPRALKPLTRLYRRSKRDNEIREAAIEAVESAADESVIGVLVSALYDEWWKVRAAASRALIRIGAPARDRVARLLNDEDERIREAAAHILNAIGAPDDAGEPDQEIGALVRSLRATDTEARERAARTLDSIHWEPETDADRMWYAVAKKDWEAVTGFGDSAIDGLIAALDDDDRRTRRTLINLIPRFGAPAIDPLVKKLLYGEAKLRPAVARMLSEMGKDAVAPLIIALRDPDAGVRQAAAAALGEIGTAAVDPLLDALRNGDNAVRRAAVDALGRVGVPAVSPILRMLNKLEGDARTAASEALQKIGENQRGSDSVIKPLR